MLKTLSIKSLYTLALAEGEGVGTAYEYFAKRLVLSKWLPQVKRPSRILIAGLPQKYGSSLDFLQLAKELGAAVTVVDERPFALQKLQSALTAAQAKGWLQDLSLKTQHTPDLASLDGMVDLYDLCISSEVLQRLSHSEQAQYTMRLRELGTAVALFSPNGDNTAHTNISGLSGLTLSQLRTLCASMFTHPLIYSNYIDMPPFPPGITRSDEQREQANSGFLEALIMWGLGYYARLEKVLPIPVRRRQSHIVYALVSDV